MALIALLVLLTRPLIVRQNINGPVARTAQGMQLNVTAHPESRSGCNNVLRSMEKMEPSVLRVAQHIAFTVCSVYKLLLRYYSNCSMCEKKNGRSS